MTRAYKLDFALLSGILLALGFLVPPLWPLGLFGYVPLFFALLHTKRKRSAYVLALLAVLIPIAGATFYMVEAYPFDWALIEESRGARALSIALWLYVFIPAAAVAALWGVVVQKYIARRGAASRILLASSWVVVEFARVFATSLTFIGAGNLIGAHWTLGSIGYIFAEFPAMLSLAAVGGIWLLGFLVILINLLVFDALRKQFSLFHLALPAFLIILAGVMFLLPRKNTGEIRIAALNTYISETPGPARKVARDIQVQSLMAGIAQDKKPLDLIVLPETAQYVSTLSPAEQEALFNVLESRNDGPAILNPKRASLSGNAPLPHAALTVFDGSGEPERIHEKVLLSPFGEYLPGFSRYAGAFLFGDAWLSTYGRARLLARGEGAEPTAVSGFKVGALFCSEVVTPALYRKVTQNGAEILTNSASHALFGNSTLLYYETIKYAKTRAVENGRAFVMAGNGVPSFAVSSRGEILGKTEWNNPSVLYAALPTYSHHTFFNRTGTGAWIALFTAVSIALLYYERGKKK